MKYYVDWKAGYRIFDESGKQFCHVKEVHLGAPCSLILSSFPEGNADHGWLTTEGDLRVEEDVAYFGVRVGDGGTT